MDRSHARSIAEEALDRWVRQPGVEVVVDDRRTRDLPAHWVFYYDTREFLETRNPEAALTGNVPLVVDKRTATPWFARPLVPVEDQLT